MTIQRTTHAKIWALCSLCMVSFAVVEADAARTTGVSYETAQSSSSREDRKQVVVQCPVGKQIIGGGARIVGDQKERVVLTALRPEIDATGRHSYTAAATEVSTGTSSNWFLAAYAVCADPVPGHEIKFAATSFSSSSVKSTAAVCPAGKRVLGSGASIFADDDTAQVGLTVARSSGPGDISRAQAHEHPSGYFGRWQLVAYAICAARPDGYEVIFASSSERESESVKEAVAVCPLGKQLLSAGSAISNRAPADVSLSYIFPTRAAAFALAVENRPTSNNWDFIVATAICADE